MSKAVERRGKGEEALQDGRKKKSAAARELVFIKLHLDPRATREAHALLGDQPRKMRLAFNLRNALNDILRVCGAVEIVKPQNFLQGRLMRLALLINF